MISGWNSAGFNIKKPSRPLGRVNFEFPTLTKIVTDAYHGTEVASVASIQNDDAWGQNEHEIAASQDSAGCTRNVMSPHNQLGADINANSWL